MTQSQEGGAAGKVAGWAGRQSRGKTRAGVENELGPVTAMVTGPSRCSTEL